MFKLSIIIFILLLLSGCSVIPYQEAHQSKKNNTAWDGYLDEKIAPNIYVIEVSQKGGYQLWFDAEESFKKYKNYWQRRANELCPSGYKGESEVIQPYKARIERFRCDLRFCQEYPMISGVVECL